MNFRNYFIFTLIIVAITSIGLFSVVSSVFADDSCLSIFNGGKSCLTSKIISVKKEIKDPQTNMYVPFLTTSGPYFSPDQQIIFRVTVENISNNKLTNITVTDTFPQYMTYVKGNGTYDTKKKTLNTKFDSLEAKERKTYEITGKIASAKDIPQPTMCFINVASTTVRGSTSQTNTQYCVQKTQTTNQQPTPEQPTTPTTKGGLPVQDVPTQSNNGKLVYAPQSLKQVPPTGAETIAWMALLPTGLIGMLLRKRSSNS